MKPLTTHEEFCLQNAAHFVVARGRTPATRTRAQFATHARFRAKLAHIVALAEAGDIAGLQAFEINPVSSSPKAMARYRDLCVIAITARAQVAVSRSPRIRPRRSLRL